MEYHQTCVYSMYVIVQFGMTHDHLLMDILDDKCLFIDCWFFLLDFGLYYMQLRATMDF